MTIAFFILFLIYENFQRNGSTEGEQQKRRCLHMKKRHIVFELNNDFCALAINDILEIKALDTMVKTTNTELNVVLWEQKSLPVIDPYAMLTLRPHKPTMKSRIAIVERNGMQFGILYDAVLGTVDIDMSEVVEPMLNEPRYVNGIHEDKIKLFKPEALLTKKILENFEVIYKIELYHLEEGIAIHGQKADGKNEIVEDARLRALNWLVKATRNEIEQSFIEEVLEIHDLISRL